MMIKQAEMMAQYMQMVPLLNRIKLLPAIQPINHIMVDRERQRKVTRRLFQMIFMYQNMN